MKPTTITLHSRADNVVPHADSKEFVRNSGVPNSALIEVGADHPLAELEPLEMMVRACQVRPVFHASYR